MWGEFIDEDRYGVRLDMKDDGTGRIWVIPEVVPFPATFGLELGEMLYQLRSALDACVYEAAILETGEDPPPDEQSLEFPICSSEQDFKKAAWKMRPLTGKRRRIVESMQPYKAPEVRPEIAVFSMQRALAILHDWARKDRHRQLHVLASWAANKNPLVRSPEGTELTHILVTGECLLEHDALVAEFHLAGWQPGMDIEVNPNLSIDLAVDELPRPCADTDTFANRSRMMTGTVAQIVNEFEKSFQ